MTIPFDNSYLSGVILTILGLILGFIFSRITNRLTQIKYWVRTTKLAISADDGIHGRLEIKHQDVQLKNFYFSNIRLRNESHTDLENVRIAFFVGKDVLILTDYIRYNSSISRISYSPEYSEVLNQPNNPLIFTRREYILPVLNRGQEVHLELTLTHGEHAQSPVIYGSCLHRGVKLSERPNEIEFHGVPMSKTLPWAIIAGLAIYSLMSSFVMSGWIVGIVCLITGFFGQSISAYLIRGWCYIFRKIGLIPPNDEL